MDRFTDNEPHVDDSSDDSQIDVDATIPSTTIDLLEPPTPVLAVYNPFIKWLLASPIEELTSIHSTLPEEIAMLQDSFIHSKNRSTSVHSFPTRAQAEFARAEIEAECEAVSDLLSMAQRECNGISDKVVDLQDERDHSREQIALLESRIVKHLQDRDLAIAEKYTTEKQIVEIEQWKAQHPQRSGSVLLGFLKMGNAPTSPNRPNGTREIEKLQKEIADTKMDIAVAKSELDTHCYRLRQLEKQSMGVKLEIAQAKALEEDLRTSLQQLRHARRISMEKLQSVSMFK